jgi:hypothetical protein
MNEPLVTPAPHPEAAAPAPGASLPAPRKRRSSAQALAARRANLVKARAADPDLIYRSTERRRAASRANIQKAIAWRRSPEGNARARLNALKHGLCAKKFPELLACLGEAPEDLSKHRARVERVFRPETEEEAHLIERLARATWRRMQLFRAQARREQGAWQKLARRAGRGPRITLEQLTDRACAVSRYLFRGENLESEAYALELRIERILKSLLRERAKGKGIGD